jgi:hypothetical protein
MSVDTTEDRLLNVPWARKSLLYVPIGYLRYSVTMDLVALGRRGYPAGKLFEVEIKVVKSFVMAGATNFPATWPVPMLNSTSFDALVTI